jgi:serine palmitoyltransferase
MADRGGRGNRRATDNTRGRRTVPKPTPTADYLRVFRLSLKEIRRVFGLGPSSKASCGRFTTQRWSSRLEKYIRIGFPFHDEWYDELYYDGHVTRQDSYRDSERPARKSLPAPTLKPRSFQASPFTTQASPSDLLTGENIVDQAPSTTSAPLSAAEKERQARFDKQFGPIGSRSHRYLSMHMGGELPELVVDEPAKYYLWTTYISYFILTTIGRIRDFFGKIFRASSYKHIKAADGYAPLNSDFDNFYFRRLKMRMNDCFSRPITGVPGRYVTLMDRETKDYNKHFHLTGTFTETLNLSSYNYLGFAQSEGPCADAVQECIEELGISYVSSRADTGTSDLTVEVEKEIAKFVAKPEAMIFSMGFSTNATSFSGLVGEGCLVISDELNHASIRVGTRISGTTIRTYKHNDMNDLERRLRTSISQGQPNARQHRPWRKILVVAEGLFSMEGTIVDLPGLLRLKKKYKFYLFIDEAHSIGALGRRGRGVCDYFNIDPSEVDILMGTLTKSFGANGGYVAADKHIIDKLRATNAAMLYGESPAPPVLMQILSSLKVIAGEASPGEGEERLQRIAFNSRYLRLGLKRLGFIVYGHDDSPVIPLILYHPGKLPAFSREMLRRKISIVIAGYPATPVISARARFCVSAAHNKEDLDRVLVACDEIGDLLQLKFSTGIAGGTDTILDGEISDLDEKQSAIKSKDVIEPPRWALKEVLATGVRDAKMQLRPANLPPKMKQ